MARSLHDAPSHYLNRLDPEDQGQIYREYESAFTWYIYKRVLREKTK